jgi:hypothetical protein
MSTPLVVGGEGRSWIEVLPSWPVMGREVSSSLAEEEGAMGKVEKEVGKKALIPN